MKKLLLAQSLCVLVSVASVQAQAPKADDIPQTITAAAQYQSDQSLEPLRRLEELTHETSPAIRTKLEAGLIKLLGTNSTFEAHRFACKQLGIIGSAKALPALSELLKSDETAGIACLALTTYPRGKADTVLRDTLQRSKGTPKSRIQIINTVGDRRDEKDVKLLSALAREAEDGPDPEGGVGQAAVAALGKIGNRAAYREIVTLCGCADNELEASLQDAKLRCAERFAVSGDGKEARAIYNELVGTSQRAYLRRGALLGLMRLDPDGGEQRILDVIGSGDPVLEPVALAAVGRLPSPAASEKFAQELTNLPAQAQAWLLESLTTRGDAPARSTLEHCLESADPEVRHASMEGLGRIGNSASVPPLALAMGSSQSAPETRMLQSTLVNLPGGILTDQAVLRELGSSGGEAHARLLAVLARRQGAAANAVLLEEATESVPAVAKAAFVALAKTATADDVPELLQRLVSTKDADVRSEAESCASQALSRVDDTSRRATILQAAIQHADNAEGRIALLRLLPFCGDAKSLQTLEEAEVDSDVRVHQAAVRALADWPNAAAWDALADAARHADDEALRATAMHGLARLAEEENAHPDAKLMQRYRQLLANAQGEADLKLILSSLSGVAAPEALDIALPLLSNPGVHAEAVVAVKKIAESIKAKHPEIAEQALQQISTAKN